MPNPKSHTVSTAVTGGRGVGYESRVGAFYISAILGENGIFGLPSHFVGISLKFQQKEQGSTLDDLVVLVEDNAVQARLDLQIKSTFSLGLNQHTRIHKNLFKYSSLKKIIKFYQLIEIMI
jgi:hypothetical protein